ncbi:MAG: DNA polymerase III subunit gamma/tau [Acidobacteria bacterium]|nr:DNA polymerase III subunit gamma/tau [Acidobacteriota bacterium]
MSYQVIARKWRPKQFDDVIGQQTVTRTLTNAIQLGRVAHAYLFTGTRGVGKTSTARIMAKALNCHLGITPTPCDECPSCTEIAAGNSVDVLEIDAASNRGIGEIRELRENVQYAPSRDRYKIFIIDEVHMLTSEAFNALLKTLEEPPSHVVFILATTELFKIPQTILSRCQQFDFRIIPFAEIRDRLMKILAAEAVTLSPQAVSFIVKASGGSMRDAESALQKIVSLGGAQISDEDVAALLGVIQQDMLNRMMRAVLARDRADIITIIDQLYNRGHDLQNFIRTFIEYIRHMTVYKILRDDDQLITLSPEDIHVLKESAETLTVEDLMRFYELLLSADNELRWTPFPRFHVEMAFLRLAALTHLVSLEEIISALADLPAPQFTPELADAPPTRTTRTAPSTPPSPASESPAAGAATAPAADTEKVTLLLQKISRGSPPLRPLLDKVEWQITGDQIHIQATENSLPDKKFREPETQAEIKAAYRELFQIEPEILVTAGKKVVLPNRQEMQRKIAAQQDELENLFLQDPVIRILTEKITGRWTYKTDEKKG